MGFVVSRDAHHLRRDVDPERVDALFSEESGPPARAAPDLEDRAASQSNNEGREKGEDGRHPG